MSSAPAKHPLQDIAAEYARVIDDLIKRNFEWWRVASTSSEIEFGNSTSASIKFAEYIANSAYDSEKDLEADGSKFIENLELLLSTIRRANVAVPDSDSLIYTEFDSIVLYTINDIRELPGFTSEPTKTSTSSKDTAGTTQTITTPKNLWLLRHDGYKTGPIVLNNYIPASTTNLPDEDVKGVEEMFATDKLIVFALDPVLKVLGFGRIELDNSSLYKTAIIENPLGDAEQTVVKGYINNFSKDYFKKLNGQNRLLFKAKGSLLLDILDLLEGRKPSYKRLHNYLLSDQYADLEKDALGFKTYADTISGLLSDQSTNPPLNIAIIAPWGRGKTTLMRMVKKHFDDERKKEDSVKPPAENAPAKLKDLRRWFRQFSKDSDPPVPQKVYNPTVWFNPWNYQSSEMIWSGLAHAIINQIVEQLPLKEQEAFWFRLKMARVDKQKLRHELYIGMVYVALMVLGFTGAIICAIVYFAFNHRNPAVTVVGLFAGVTGVYNTVMSFLKPDKETVAKTFTNLTQPPNYEQKLGVFHEVNEDVKKVLDLLVDEEKPPIIFVDDLDRCSPGKVVEVIEAINLFMSGDFNNRCYFVIGMDAEIVAAALDVAYEKMKGQIKRNETEQGSIGWYFLDKFIQLPFFIPVLDKTKKEKYLSEILGGNDLPRTEAHTKPAEKGADELAGALQQPINDEAKKQLVKEQPKEVVEAYNKRIIAEQISKTQDDPEIKEQVAVYADFLGGDPRSLKRFANLLRFYGSYQYLRMTKGDPHVEIRTLAKWLAIMIRFPKMIRWIQWEDDSSLVQQQSPGDKAKTIDTLIGQVTATPEWTKDYANWLLQKIEFLKDKEHPDGYTIAELNDSHWIKSKVFFQIMHQNREKAAAFANALECNVL